VNVNDFLEETAYISDMNFNGEINQIYKSKFDDSYMTHVGMEDSIKFLADREITQELTHGVGFSPKEGKWYGWSHRAIFGFEIGSTCKKGNCHYTASTPEEMIDDHANFFADISQECAEEHRAECQILPDKSGIRILHTPLELPVIENIEDIENAINDIGSVPVQTLFKDDYSVIKCGKGEWTAKTMADAKQMAKDFNEGVS